MAFCAMSAFGQRGRDVDRRVRQDEQLGIGRDRHHEGMADAPRRAQARLARHHRRHEMIAVQAALHQHAHGAVARQRRRGPRRFQLVVGRVDDFQPAGRQARFLQQPRDARAAPPAPARYSRPRAPEPPRPGWTRTRDMPPPCAAGPPTMRHRAAARTIHRSPSFSLLLAPPARRAGLGPARRRAASRGRIGRPRRIPAPGSSRPHPYLWIRRAPVLAPSVPPARSTAAFPRCEGLVDVGLVLLQEAHRLLERVAAERIAQFLAHHHLQHRGLALGLRLAGRAQRVAHLVGVLDPQALRPHSARQLGEVRVLQIAADETATVEVHLVLLFRAPLAVMEHHRRHRNALAHAGQQFLEAHAPGAVAHIGHGRTIGPAQQPISAGSA